MNIHKSLLIKFNTVEPKATNACVGKDTVVQVGAAPAPAEVNNCPDVPKLGDDPTPKARDVFMVKPVVPLDCNAKTPEESAVVLSPAEPDTTPLSAFMVVVMCYSGLLLSMAA